MEDRYEGSYIIAAHIDFGFVMSRLWECSDKAK